MEQRLNKTVHISEPLSELAKTTLTTQFDDSIEEYILTEDEANSAIEHEVVRLIKHYEWKFSGRKRIITDLELMSKMDAVDIESKIDVVAILERANSIKHYSIWEAKQREKEKLDAEKKQKELKEIWNANKFYNLIKWASENYFQRPLVVNNDTMNIIKPLCFFLSGDKRFETELGYDLNKGLCFRGISGLGKTHIVKCAAENELHRIFVVSMLEIASEVKDEGEYSLPQGYSKFYLDDVGSEEHIQNHYGTKINWFKNFIETFYLRSQQYNRLIISTNNTAMQIEEKYGFRVRSRFKDMFNIIDVSGKDLRG